MSKKLKIILPVVAFILIAMGALTVFLVSRHNEAQAALQYEIYVNTSLQNIERWNHDFNRADNHDRRVELYHGLNRSYMDYINGDTDNNDELVSKFETTLFSMKERFFDYYVGEITIIEETEFPEDIKEKITVIESNIEKLRSVEAGVSVDGVLTNSDTMMNQVTGKIEPLIEYYTQTIRWMGEITDLHDSFLLANRDGKLDIFIDFLSLQDNYYNNDFTSAFVDMGLIAIIEEQRLWFHDWYTESREMLRPDETHRYNLGEFINLFSQLNDLIELFDQESEILFTQTEAVTLLSSFDEAVSSNIAELENIGTTRINRRDFRIEAEEKALELFNELFSEWIENHGCNEHLMMFEDILYEAISLGNDEHRQSLRNEAARRTRTGFT